MYAQDQNHIRFAVGATILLLCTWGWGLFMTPSDQAMGEVYRVIYLHVPAAITAFLQAYVLLAFSLLSFRPRSETAILWARGAAEAGLILTLLTLATGSIWGYPTWGVWWTWDARITTTFLLALLFAGYLLLYNSLPSGARRTKACAVLGILIAVDVPIIYKSVTWWRTLHQPPSLMRDGGATMDPEMLRALLANLAAMMLVSVALLVLRVGNLKLQQQAEHLSIEAGGKAL